MRFGLVCEDCNNGWLSELESDTKATLNELWQGQRRLPVTDAMTLTVWVLKTASLLNLASNYRRIVPAHHLHGLFDGTIPSGAFADLAFASQPHGVTWFQSQNMQIVADEESAREARTLFRRSGYHFAFGLGDVLLWCVFFPNPRFLLGPFDADGRRRCCRLWPPQPTFYPIRQHRYDTVFEFVDEAWCVYASEAA